MLEEMDVQVHVLLGGLVLQLMMIVLGLIVLNVIVWMLLVMVVQVRWGINREILVRQLMNVLVSWILI